MYESLSATQGTMMVAMLLSNFSTISLRSLSVTIWYHKPVICLALFPSALAIKISDPFELFLINAIFLPSGDIRANQAFKS
jgi:hypothetical protein